MKGFNRLSGALHGAVSHTLSNLRLSLTFRIAIHYCFQLLRTTLPMALIVSLFFFGAQLPGMLRLIHRIAIAPLPESSIYTQDVIQDAHVSAVVLSRERYCQETGLRALPSNSKELIQEFFRTAFSQELVHRPFYLTVPSMEVQGYLLRVTFALEDMLSVWGWLMTSVLVCDTVRMLGFIRRRNQLDKRVLAPIRDITDMAATLSANNLSNRINIAGTKNELKDLAMVINTMLDRIELSYNSQKQFVSDASHELRTPIAVIQGYANLINRWGKSDPEVLQESIDSILTETDHMSALIRQLLFLAKGDQNKLHVQKTRVSLNEIAAELVREMDLLQEGRSITFTAEDEVEIFAEYDLIKQLLWIHGENALKYSPNGSEIAVRVWKDASFGYVSVEDHGAGIAEEDLRKIFDRFYRADKSRNKEVSGTGLGLAIARWIIDCHDGEVLVESKVGEGTIFTDKFRLFSAEKEAK